MQRAKIDTCYLDTTYLNPRYCFPPQPQVIEACASLARRTVLGLSDNAPPLPDSKDDVKDGILNEAEEQGKDLISGWLVKREEGVKTELDDGNGPMDGITETAALDTDVKVEKKKGRTLVVMGTYSIGKERIVKGERSLCALCDLGKGFQMMIKC